MRNVEVERNYLVEEFPDMKESIAAASDKAISIAYDMLNLDKEELELFAAALEERSKK